MQRSTFITLVVIVLIILVAGIFTFYRVNQISDAGSEANKALSSVTGESIYTDLSNDPVNLNDWTGKVRVVNSWATWCPFCVNELPDFNTLAEEYADQGVVVIAINRKENTDLVKAYLASNNIQSEVLFIQDATDNFYKTIGGFSMPETVFYDEEGNISFHKRGFMTLEEMRTHTKTAINATAD